MNHWIHFKSLNYSSSLHRSDHSLWSLLILILFTTQVLTPNTARAEQLIEVQKKYNESVCKEETKDQTKTYCESAKDSLLAADMSVFLASVFGAEAAICAAACATGEPTVSKVCKYTDMASAALDLAVTVAVTKEYNEAIQGVMMFIGVKMTGSTAASSFGTKAEKAALEKGASDEKAKEAGEKKERKVDGCITMVGALLAVAMKTKSAVEAVKTANESIENATKQTGGNITTIAAAGASGGGTSSKGGNTGGRQDSSGGITPIDPTDPQSFNKAMSMATAGNNPISKSFNSKPFSDTFGQVSGQGLGQFMANSKNDPLGAATAAASAGLGLSPSDSAQLSSMINDFQKKIP
ncbi:hypothetical protein EBS43_09660, partial [bacterium]|nr:hypothetical protein [bacterium]